MRNINELFEGGNYIYKGIELTPAVMAELVFAFYNGKQFKRQDAIKTVVDYHRENGGLLEKNDYVSVFKKACNSALKDISKNKGYGVWYIAENEENDSISDVPDVKDEGSEVSPNEEIVQLSDKIIGVGDKAVYVYYYDTYKQCAILKGSKVWACKVGRTDVDPIQRVLGQAGTCYPELPHIALIIRCDNSNMIETTLHTILKLRGKWMDYAPGTEWFMTSPEEIETIYNGLFESKE